LLCGGSKEELEVVEVVKWWENEAEDVDAFKEFDANNLRAFLFVLS